MFNTAGALAEFWIVADARAVWLRDPKVVAGGRVVVFSAGWAGGDRWVVADALLQVFWIVVPILLRAILDSGGGGRGR